MPPTSIVKAKEHLGPYGLDVRVLPGGHMATSEQPEALAGLVDELRRLPGPGEDVLSGEAGSQNRYASASSPESVARDAGCGATGRSLPASAPVLPAADQVVPADQGISDPRAQGRMASIPPARTGMVIRRRWPAPKLQPRRAGLRGLGPGRSRRRHRGRWASLGGVVCPAPRKPRRLRR